jgi:hypothetical protein
LLGLGGLALPDFLRAKAASAESGANTSDTSIIYIELAGGPTHFETYDPKPEAPIEFRGPLGAISTNVPGVQFSEMMTHQARVADKLAIIRSMTHDSSSHGTSSHLTQTGYYLRDRQSRENDMPSIGSVTAKVRGACAPGLPAYAALPKATRFGNAAYIGKQFNPLESVMDADRSDFEVQNLSLNKELQLARVEDRRTLLASLDHARQLFDLEGVAQAQEEYTAQAFEMVTGARAQKAFDIAQENEKLRKKYGNNPEGQNMLLARRLVEAGVTFVSVRVQGWDMHGNVERGIKSVGTKLDQGVAALVSDLYDRGLNRKVLVVVMGEFGRTPRINKNAGRDHWGSAMSVLMAGGDFRMGQVIGATNSKGEMPTDLPYRPEHVLTMMYRHLGIDPGQTFNDRSGRPRYVLEQQGLIPELI